MSQHLHKEQLVLLEAVQEAGELALSLQSKQLQISHSKENRQTTNADIQINQLLQKKLCAEFPNYGWLSEESTDDISRLQKSKVWIVDPLDGTKEYILGLPEYAISVALVESGTPILSCVYNPAMDELYYATKGEGFWLNHKRIAPKKSVKNIALVSRSEYETGFWNNFKHAEIKPLGSVAYRLAQIALGNAALTLSFSGRNDWDIAAGVHLLKEMGGITTTMQNQPLTFNQKAIRKPNILAAYSKNYHQSFLQTLHEDKIYEHIK